MLSMNYPGLKPQKLIPSKKRLKQKKIFFQNIARKAKIQLKEDKCYLKNIYLRLNIPFISHALNLQRNRQMKAFHAAIEVSMFKN